MLFLCEGGGDLSLADLFLSQRSHTTSVMGVRLRGPLIFEGSGAGFCLVEQQN